MDEHAPANNQIAEANQLLRSNATDFVITDAQSFSVVKGEQFQKLIISAVDIG